MQHLSSSTGGTAVVVAKTFGNGAGLVVAAKTKPNTSTNGAKLFLHGNKVLGGAGDDELILSVWGRLQSYSPNQTMEETAQFVRSELVKLKGRAAADFMLCGLVKLKARAAADFILCGFEDEKPVICTIKAAEGKSRISVTFARDDVAAVGSGARYTETIIQIFGNDLTTNELTRKAVEAIVEAMVYDGNCVSCGGSIEAAVVTSDGCAGIKTVANADKVKEILTARMKLGS